MRKSKKKTIVAIIIAAVVIVAGVLCIATLRQDYHGYNWFDRNKTVVKVGNESVTFGEYKFRYEQYLTGSQIAIYYQIGMRPDEDLLLKTRQEVLDTCALTRVFTQKGKAMGLKLTDAQKNVIRLSGEVGINQLKDQIANQAQGYTLTDAQLDSQVGTYFANLGINRAQYIEMQKVSAEAAAYAELIMSEYEKDGTFSEESLRAQYDIFVDTYFNDYMAGDYSAQLEAYQQGSVNYQLLNIPDDFLFVRVIKVTGAEAADEIAARLENGEDFEEILASDANEDSFGKLMDAAEGYGVGPQDSIFGDDDKIYDAAKEKAIGDWGKVEVASETEGEEATYYFFKRVEGKTGKVPYEKWGAQLKDTLQYMQLTESLLTDVVLENQNIIVDLENVLFPIDGNTLLAEGAE